MQNLSRKVLLLLALMMLVISACGSESEGSDDKSDDQASNQQKSRILWVDSYDAEYAWSADIEAGLRSNLDNADNVEWKLVRMDTKRNTEEEYCMTTGEAVLAEIEAYQPDVLIVTDDNAQRCLVVPHLMDSELPIVFAAVNWDASEYGYPTDHITGMIEVELVRESVELMREYAEGDNICYVSADTTTEQKRQQIYAERFADLNMDIHIVKTFDAFKEAFLECQKDANMAIIGSNAGIEDWDDAEAEAFFLENTQIPTATREDWMASYTLLSLTKLGFEQGDWASETALEILDGKPVSEIPMAENYLGGLIINLPIADHLGLALPPALIRSADRIIGTEE